MRLTARIHLKVRHDSKHIHVSVVLIKCKEGRLQSFCSSHARIGRGQQASNPAYIASMSEEMCFQPCALAYFLAKLFTMLT